MAIIKECIVEMSDVWKVYLMGKVEVPAIRGLNFCVSKGEYVSIMGPSGSGKSTLLNLVGCLDTPTVGQILLGGINIALLSENELAAIRRRSVGFIFQTFNLLPGLTAQENVALPMRFEGISKGPAMQRAGYLLDLVGLSERMRHKPSEMSGGERQRVSIARSLINDPALLLADEPTGNLDTKTGMKIVELIEGLNERGITLIVISHDPELAKRAHRRMHLVDGRIVDDNTFQVYNNNNKPRKK
jgi:putative ABC transport system ATP-binding protein